MGVIRQKSRAFNDVIMDLDRCMVRKNSTNVAKLRSEYNWYKELPLELQGFTPHCISFIENEKSASLLMDYCTFSDLSYFYTMKTSLSWSKILGRLLLILTYFSECKADADSLEVLKSEVQEFYISKFRSRVQKIMNMGHQWNELLREPVLKIDGKNYLNINFAHIEEVLKQHSANVDISAVHGDYCLSNILYDPDSECVKLIDPRGHINGMMTPYGDIYYDYAKLLHSVHGCYDYIVRNKYLLLEFNSEYTFDIHTCPHQKRASEFLLNHIKNSMPSMYEILLFIEVSLFVSMIPLHYEDPQRQKAFYLRAVQLYNELV